MLNMDAPLQKCCTILISSSQAFVLKNLADDTFLARVYALSPENVDCRNTFASSFACVDYSTTITTNSSLRSPNCVNLGSLRCQSAPNFAHTIQNLPFKPRQKSLQRQMPLSGADDKLHKKNSVEPPNARLTSTHAGDNGIIAQLDTHVPMVFLVCSEKTCLLRHLCLPVSRFFQPTSRLSVVS